MGDNALLVPTFWVNSHFGLKIDFVTNVIPKKWKSFLKWPLPSANQQKNPMCLTECLACWCGVDIAIKIFKKKLFGIF